MLRKLRERMESEKGFTLIELLVVILIIGILAAIALPAFLGQREKAQDAEAKTAVRNASSAAKAYYTDAGTFANMNAGSLRTIEPSLNDGAAAGANLVVSNVTPTTYTVRVNQTKTGNWFEIRKFANGRTERHCQNQNQGGCPNGGRW